MVIMDFLKYLKKFQVKNEEQKLGNKDKDNERRESNNEGKWVRLTGNRREKWPRRNQKGEKKTEEMIPTWVMDSMKELEKVKPKVRVMEKEIRDPQGWRTGGPGGCGDCP